MENVAPLIQTTLWVSLIVWIVWRFHAPIYGILNALQKRLETGSTFKAGPFEIIDRLRPQELEKQKEKAEVELRESLSTAGSIATEQTAESSATTLSARRTQLFQAEDLALRAIQAEYGQPINRQLTAGSDLGFDGVFIVGGRLNIVEVKYISDKWSVPSLRQSLEQMVSTVSRYHWKNVELLLVVVFEKEEDVSKSDVTMCSAVEGLAIPVTIRPYSLPELQSRFGLEAGNSG